MPTKSPMERAKQDLREGKSPATAAGEFVREEIEHVRQGKHGVRSPKQAIAIGLSEARRSGIPLQPPAPGKTTEKTRRSAERAFRKGQTAPAKKSKARTSRVREDVLKREPKNTVSRAALSKQARSAARRRKVTAISGNPQASKASGRNPSRGARRKAA